MTFQERTDWVDEPKPPPPPGSTPVKAADVLRWERGIAEVHEVIEEGRLSPESLDAEYRDGVEEARAGAVTARQHAEAAQSGAETARTEARAARDETIIAAPARIDWTGAVTLTSADVAVPRWIKARLIGNTTVMVPPGTAGRAYTVTLEVSQDATGGRTLTVPGVSWPQSIAPAVTAAANARDLLFLTWTGSDWIGTVGGQSLAIMSGGGA